MPDRQRLLELALKGLEAERAKINDEIVELKTQLGDRHLVLQGSEVKKRTMSAAARKKISEAMKRRYAEMSQVATKAGSPSPLVRKSESVGLKLSSAGKKQIAGGLTAAGRKKLSDLMKKRWADKRKEKAK